MARNGTDKLRHRRNKEYIRLYKQSRCCEQCGEARAVCLDFHHKEPDTKRFGLTGAETYSIAAIDAEMRKCVLVCANCHRVLHAEDIRLGLGKAEDKEILPLFDLL